MAKPKRDVQPASLDSIEGEPVDRPFETDDRVVWLQDGAAKEGKIVAIISANCATVRRNEFNDVVCIAIGPQAANTWNYGK